MRRPGSVKANVVAGDLLLGLAGSPLNLADRLPKLTNLLLDFTERSLCGQRTHRSTALNVRQVVDGRQAAALHSRNTAAESERHGGHVPDHGR
jgi:hypothetical protein